MSQENVEIVKRAFQAWARRGVEAVLGCMDPAVELQTAIIGGAEGNMYRGHEGVRQWVTESDAAFERLRVEPEEFRDAGHDVLPLLRELFAKDPKQAARRLVHVPMGRFAHADEIAQAALFLASDESSYVPASTFLVDGGISDAYTTPPGSSAPSPGSAG